MFKFRLKNQEDSSEILGIQCSIFQSGDELALKELQSCVQLLGSFTIQNIPVDMQTKLLISIAQM